MRAGKKAKISTDDEAPSRISVSLPSWVRRKMQERPDLNWSEIAREAFLKALTEELNLSKDCGPL